MQHKERGISLIIVFLIMTIMLAIVLSVSTILFNEVKLLSNMGNSASALYAAESGVEKTLYFDKKQMPPNATRGFCNICNVCNSTDCNNCRAISLATDGSNGCDIARCTNCRILYSSTFGEKTYSIDARVAPDAQTGVLTLFIDAQGFYRNTTRSISVKITK